MDGSGAGRAGRRRTSPPQEKNRNPAKPGEGQMKMNELEEARKIINQADEQMADLFARRMEAVRQIAA